MATRVRTRTFESALRKGRRITSSACLPASSVQLTALKPVVDPLGTNHPKPAIGLDERTDLDVREVETTVSQGRQGFDRSLEKIRAELLVSQNLPDDQLYGSLRHVPPVRGESLVLGASWLAALPSFGARLVTVTARARRLPTTAL
jgi:hypothetical protein